MTRIPSWLTNSAKLIYLLAAVIGLSLSTNVPVRAQPSVEALIAHIFNPDAAAYELTANFRGAFSLTTGGGSSTAGMAAGLLREWRKPGEARRWKLTVRDLDLPWLLRPFAGVVRTTIERKIETQTDALENFRDYDVFILDEQAGGRYILVGLRRDLVDEAITHFGRSADKDDPAARRLVAQWLFTAPTMQSWITRPGPAYALEVIADDTGLIHEVRVLTVNGRVGMKFSYLSVSGQPVWQEVLSTFASNVKSLGRIEGQLKLNFADYKLDRSPQWERDPAWREPAKGEHDGSDPQP